jgi:hypothetical protein
MEKVWTFGIIYLRNGVVTGRKTAKSTENEHFLLRAFVADGMACRLAALQCRRRPSRVPERDGLGRWII